MSPATVKNPCFKTAAALAYAAGKALETRYLPRLEGRRVISGIPTGFADIDAITDGLPEGVSVVGARPEYGLTDFGLNIALHAAQTHKVSYFSPDLSAEILMQRLICMRSRFSFEYSGNAARELPRLAESIEALTKSDSLAFYDAPLNPVTFYEACINSKATQGTQLIILDRLQSLFTGRAHAESDPPPMKNCEAASLFSKLAHEKGLTVLVLSEVKKGLRAKICTDDLRDKGVLEYLARPILLLDCRNDRFDEDQSDLFMGECLTLQVRIANNLATGPSIAACDLVYLRSYGRFESAARVSRV